MATKKHSAKHPAHHAAHAAKHPAHEIKPPVSEAAVAPAKETLKAPSKVGVWPYAALVVVIAAMIIIVAATLMASPSTSGEAKIIGLLDDIKNELKNSSGSNYQNDVVTLLGDIKNALTNNMTKSNEDKIVALLGEIKSGLSAGQATETQQTRVIELLSQVKSELEGSSVAAATGDDAKVSYTGKFTNGSTFDEGEFSFTLGSGQVIQGFDAAVLGMKAGDEKTVTIQPKDGYGEHDITKVRDMPLVQNRSRTEDVPLAQFSQIFGKEPVLNEEVTVSSVDWPLKVVNITTDSVTVQHNPAPGQMVIAPYGNISVSASGDVMTMKIVPIIGASISGGLISGFDENNMQIDSNHPLAGKVLVFTIKVLNVTKTDPTQRVCGSLGLQKSDRPVLELDIFSFCPAGVAAQKSLVPVAKLLGGKADFTVRFFSNMHGEHEKAGNIQQECVQKLYPAKYWDYADRFTTEVYGVCRDVSCLNEKTTKIMQDVGIGVDAVAACVKNEGDALYAADIANAESMRLQYSPSFIINGKYLSNLDRSPEGIKAALCCAFNEMPVECASALGSQDAPASGGCGA